MSDDLATSNAPFVSSVADALADGRTYRTTYDPDEDRPSTGVAVAVAAVLGTDPTALEPRLYDVVDPDALDSLFTARDGVARLSLEMAGCRVTVSADGVVRAERLD